MRQLNKLRRGPRGSAVAATVILAMAALVFTRDDAAAGTDNRAPAPNNASASSGRASHGTIADDVSTKPTVKTDRPCRGRLCHVTH